MAASMLLGIGWGIWHMPVWFSRQWTEPTISNIIFFLSWISAATFIYTWLFNNTKGSLLMAILAHASMDAFPNAILWPLFPAATKLTEYGFLYGYLGLIVGFGSTAVLLILFTRRRLGYQHYSPENRS